MVLSFFRRDVLDEGNGSVPMCRLAQNLLHIIVWEGQGTEKASWTKPPLLLAEDFLKTLQFLRAGCPLSQILPCTKQYYQNMKKLHSIVIKSLNFGTRLPEFRNQTVTYRVCDLGQVISSMCPSLSPFVKHDNVVPTS